MWKPTRNLRRPFSSASSQAGGTPSNPYPYPQHPNPRPHQIFHLPFLASQDDIKRRCTTDLVALRVRVDGMSFADYDLVRIHHPDSPVVRALGLTPDVAHARFQSISAAYDVLRGNNSQGSDNNSEVRTAANAATATPRRSAHANRPDIHVVGDDRWKDRILLGGVVLVRPLIGKIIRIPRT